MKKRHLYIIVAVLAVSAFATALVGCASWQSYGLRLKYTDGDREVVLERDTLNAHGVKSSISEEDPFFK